MFSMKRSENKTETLIHSLNNEKEHILVFLIREMIFKTIPP
jgi:hypothetical protein